MIMERAKTVLAVLLARLLVHPDGADSFAVMRHRLPTKTAPSMFQGVEHAVHAPRPAMQLSSSPTTIPGEHQFFSSSSNSAATVVVSVRCEDFDLKTAGHDDVVEQEEDDDHIERLEIPRPQSYREMIDAVMERYEYRGVRFCDTNAVWKVTSESGRFTALAGRVDDIAYPTDVFPTSEAPSAHYPCHISINDDDDDDNSAKSSPSVSTADLTLKFEVRCPREIRHGGGSGVIGGTLFFVRAMAGSSIAIAFLTAQMAALREHNPESPLAEQIASILSSSPRVVKTKKKSSVVAKQ